MLEFRGKVLFMGFGAVAHCALPILVKHIRVRPIWSALGSMRRSRCPS